jgi:hypothetical protein
VWVNAVFGSLNPGIDYCIPDMRFPNEAQRVVDNGGLTIRINRCGIVPVNNHPGEIALDGWDFDYVVENDSDIAYLKQIAEDIFT